MTHTIQARALALALEQESPPLLIDVLPAVSHARRRIPAAVNESAYSEGFEERVLARAGDQARPLVVHCWSASCNAAEQARGRLVVAGFQQVEVLEGGLDAWVAAGLPIEGAEA